jgi:hypothetical protein
MRSLLDVVARGKVSVEDLGPKRVKALRENGDAGIRDRAALLPGN